MTWKNTERAIAKRLNGQRVGATGKATADVLTDRLAVEVKHRKELPGWLKDALMQAVNAAGERTPLVVLHEAGQRHRDDLVVMRLQDLERLLSKQF
jgi:hypothetical protein